MEPRQLTEAKILIRELWNAGYDARELRGNNLFETALLQYAQLKLSHDGLFDIASKLAIFNPSIKHGGKPIPPDLNF